MLLADAIDHDLPVDQERAGGAWKEQRVCSLTAIDLVDPQTTVQRVVAGTAVQRVITGSAVQYIVACTAGQRVIARQVERASFGEPVCDEVLCCSDRV